MKSILSESGHLMAHKLSIADRNDFVTGKRRETMRPLKNLVMFIIPKKTMGFFSVPKFPGWSFQHPSASHFKKAHGL
jgi:hypothetical protein